MTTKQKKSKNRGGVFFKPPFPTQAEIVRLIANALNIKQENKAKDIDAFVETGDTDYQKFPEMLEEYIFEPIKSLTCESTAKFLRSEIDSFFKSYRELVRQVSLDRIIREESLPLLIEHYFSVMAARFLTNFQSFSGGISPIDFVASDKTAIAAVFQWFHENEKGWDSNCIKEEKDKYREWQKGKYLPSITSFKLLPVSPENKTLLMIAGAADSFRRSELGKSGINSTRQHLLLGFDQYDHSKSLSLAQLEASKKFPLSTEAINNCNNLLFDSTDSSNISSEYAYERIEELKAALKKEDPNGLMSYLINWIEARWHVKTGNLKDSLKFYKPAFEQCSYSAGKGQELIFKDALKVAAKARDLTFLKQLKNYGIVFDYFGNPLDEDELDLSVNNKTNRGKSNIIEDWEIEKWSKAFSQTFSKSGLFKDTKPYNDNAKAGVLLTTLGEIKPKAKADQKIKVGNWNKQIPQLVHFILENDTKHVRKLLDKGADVNVYSESGETPILLAIQNMNPFEVTAPIDDTCFNIISTHSHTKETINRRSTKLKLLPLVCAINTGRIEVVEKLLEMGAEIDRRGETDVQTALNISLKRIGMLQNPSKFTVVNNSLLANPSVDLLEDIRRRSAGLVGITHDEIKAAFEVSGNNELFQSFKKAHDGIVKERTKYLDIESLRKIAALLIQRGASPNAEHISPILGYTPLMLAAESDEAELFEKMLGYGGRPDKYYKHPETGQNINCFKIAIAFRSQKVAELLKRKYGYHPFNNL